MIEIKSIEFALERFYYNYVFRKIIAVSGYLVFVFIIGNSILRILLSLPQISIYNTPETYLQEIISPMVLAGVNEVWAFIPLNSISMFGALTVVIYGFFLAAGIWLTVVVSDFLELRYRKIFLIINISFVGLFFVVSGFQKMIIQNINVWPINHKQVDLIKSLEVTAKLVNQKNLEMRFSGLPLTMDKLTINCNLWHSQYGDQGMWFPVYIQSSIFSSHVEYVRSHNPDGSISIMFLKPIPRDKIPKVDSVLVRIDNPPEILFSKIIKLIQ